MALAYMRLVVGSIKYGVYAMSGFRHSDEERLRDKSVKIDKLVVQIEGCGVTKQILDEMRELKVFVDKDKLKVKRYGK